MKLSNLKENYAKRKKEIKNRLNEFSKVKGDDIFYELCFCTLTPQSNAVKCDKCINILKNKDFIKKLFDIKPILKTKTRFYKNKSNYLIYNKKQYNYIKNSILNKNPNRPKGRGIFIVSNTAKNIHMDRNPIVASDGVFETNKKNPFESRELIVKHVKGLGYKEASHFLRNIGFRNLAILDRHILKNLQKLKVIHKIPSNLNKKNYLLIEKKFYNFSKKIKIHMDELDLLFWSIETGKVFK